MMVGAAMPSYDAVPRDQMLTQMQAQVNRTAASGKFFDNPKPPEFSGKREDFETWVQRFEWFIQSK